MQIFWIGSGEAAKEICLPPPDSEVIPGIPWGRGDMLDTAAYWALRCLSEDDPLHGFTSSDGCLIREIGFCLLGGFGITAELNGSAFERLERAGVFDLSNNTSEEEIRSLLNESFLIDGRLRRYRFPNQRSRRLASMRATLRNTDLGGLTETELKQTLLQLDGIGPKTAAWIIRNLLNSDDVAILDIHVVRACTKLQLFPETVSLPRDYQPLEERFLRFAQAMAIRPAVLDAVMWNEMRALSWPSRRNRLAPTLPSA